MRMDVWGSLLSSPHEAPNETFRNPPATPLIRYFHHSGLLLLLAIDRILLIQPDAGWPLLIVVLNFQTKILTAALALV
jgi:hypothetical protein